VASPDPTRALSKEQAAQTIDSLRLLSDQLELFLDGDDSAWTDDHVLQVHEAAVRARIAVNAVRTLRDAEARRATVIPLVPRP